MENIINKRVRVVFEQPFISNYKVPFFEEMAKYVDLLVVTSKDEKLDGIVRAGENLKFNFIKTREDRNGELLHPEIISIIKEHKADFYISWSEPISQIIANKKYYQELKKNNVKIIWVGCDGYKYQNFLTALFKQIIYGRIKFLKHLLAMRRVDKFIIYSSLTKKYLQIVKFISSKKIVVSNNAISTLTIEKRYSELKRQNVPKNKNEILFVGRLTPDKKADLLIRAFEKVLKSIPSARLKIIGDGSEMNKIKDLSKKLNINNHIEIMGGIYNDSELCDHLYRSTVYVMPGLGGLGFNSAMACGLPIIYHRGDGTENDLFKNGINGWYFDGTENDLVKKITFILNNPQTAMKAESINIEIATKLITIPNVVMKFIKCFEQLSKH